MEQREEYTVSTEVKVMDEELSRAAEQFVLSFRSAYEEALNTKEFSLIGPYLKEVHPKC